LNIYISKANSNYHANCQFVKISYYEVYNQFAVNLRVRSSVRVTFFQKKPEGTVKYHTFFNKSENNVV
jgi:hypothetical protein